MRCRSAAGSGKRVPVLDGDLRLDVARRDRVHPYALRRVLDPQRPRQAEQSMLGDGIGERARDDREGMAGRDVDDRARALCSRMAGSTVRLTVQTPSRSTAKQRRHSASVVSSGSWKTLMPALLTRMSMRPCLDMTCSAMAATEAASVTSVSMKCARRPRPDMSFATARPVSALRSAMTTLGALRSERARGSLADALSGTGDDGDLVLEAPGHGSPVDDRAVVEDGVGACACTSGAIGMGGTRGLVDLDAETRRFRHLPVAVDHADRAHARPRNTTGTAPTISSWMT